MTDRKQPTRIVETGRLVRGSSGQGVGWLQSLADRFRNLRAQVQGVQDRLTTPLRDGVPDCISGELVFEADTKRVITIQNFPLHPDTVPPNAAADYITLKVNPIMLAGETYRIPITFTPPGVLEAHNLVVGIEAGYTMFANLNRPGITPLNDYREMNGTGKTGSGFTTRDPSDGVIQYTSQQQVLGDFADVMPFIPYFWNIIDEKSGRQYGSDLIPCGALLNTRGNSFPGAHPDSDLFEFDVPWLFERDGQIMFLFRPIMDLYQIDTTDSQLPYGTIAPNGSTQTGTDDRSGGRRFERATVRVEFHGNRYYTTQDVVRDGAYVTDGPEPPRTGQGYGDRPRR